MAVSLLLVHEVETASEETVTLYRWIERDDGGTHEKGDHGGRDYFRVIRRKPKLNQQPIEISGTKTPCEERRELLAKTSGPLDT
jgi:hypothetical protein